MMSSLVQVVPQRGLVFEKYPHKQSHSRGNLKFPQMFPPIFNSRWSMDSSDTEVSFLWRVYAIFCMGLYDLIFPLYEPDM